MPQESEFLKHLLRTPALMIGYKENYIEIRNATESKIIPVPKDIVPKVQDFFESRTFVETPDEWDEEKSKKWEEISEYVFNVGLAMLELDMQQSTMKEREFKIMAYEEMLVKFKRKMEQEKKE